MFSQRNSVWIPGVTSEDPTAQLSGVGHVHLPQLDASRRSKFVPSIMAGVVNFSDG